MGEENINKLVIPQTIQNSWFDNNGGGSKKKKDIDRDHTVPQESLNGDMKEMIKFTYELKCFKDALDIKVYI